MYEKVFHITFMTSYLKDSNFWKVGILGTKFLCVFIECIWVVSMKFVWRFVHVYMISSSSQKWFSHFVLAGFWQRIWVTVTFEWLGVYTPNLDVYVLGIFGCSPLHLYGILLYWWIPFRTIWWETTLVGYTFLPVHIIS